MTVEKLDGKPCKGFVFNHTAIGYISVMNSRVGEKGVLEHTSLSDRMRIKFSDGVSYVYPLDGIIKNLIKPNCLDG